jgi:hypothetical protein
MGYTKIPKPSNYRIIYIDELGGYADKIDNLNTIASTIDGLDIIKIPIYHKIIKPTL